jgi:hypothetical protein
VYVVGAIGAGSTAVVLGDIGGRSHAMGGATRWEEPRDGREEPRDGRSHAGGARWLGTLPHDTALQGGGHCDIYL